MWEIDYDFTFSISALVSALVPYHTSSFAVVLDMEVSDWYQADMENGM
jgi:hypothetical protein